MGLSLVLLQHNLSFMTRTALASIRESDLVPDEIILVDNGSEEHEINWAYRESDLNVIRLDRNFGFTVGMNAGWKASQNELIVMCNNDIALSKQCLRRLKIAMELNTNLGWLSACYQDGAWSNSKTEFPEHIKTKLNDSLGKQRLSFDLWAEQLGDVPILEDSRLTDATVIMVRKSISEQVGYYWEELLNQLVHDYSLRLWDAGYKLATCHNSVFWHNTKSPTYRNDFDNSNWAKMDAISTQKMNERWGNRWR